MIGGPEKDKIWTAIQNRIDTDLFWEEIFVALESVQDAKLMHMFYGGDVPLPHLDVIKMYLTEILHVEVQI